MESIVEITENVIPVKRQGVSPVLVWFFIAMVLANIPGNMYGPLLPLYLKDLNAGVVEVGLFFTLSQIIPLVLQILGGWISDSLGRLRSIAMGSVAGVFSYIGLVLAPGWQWVLVGEGFSSITRSLVAPSFAAFIAEHSDEKSRARVYSISDSIMTIVVIIGPPLGGWLVDTYGFKFMLVIAGMIYASATVIRVWMARVASQGKEAHPQKLSFTVLRSNLAGMFALIAAGGLITWMLITDGVRDIGFSISFTFMPIYMDNIGGLTFQQIGWLNSIFGVANLIITLPAGWLADKKSERLAIALGFLLDAVALFIFIQASDFAGYAASWAMLGFGIGLMSPAYQSLISKAIPEKVRGTAFGLMQTSLGLFSLPAPAVGALIYERGGPRLPFVIAAVLSVVTIIPVWLKFRLPAGKDAAAPDSEAK
jgi:MFS family permease